MNNNSSVNVYKSEFIFRRTDTKINAVDHLSGITFIIGDKKGYIYLMENNQRKKEAVQIAEPIRLSKTLIERIISLSSDRLLACVLTDGVIHLVDFSNKSKIKVMSGVTNMYYYPGDRTPSGKSKFFVTQKKKCSAFLLDLNAENLNTVFKLVKDFSFPHTPDVAVWHKNSVSVAFVGREYSILDFKTGTSKEKLRKDFVQILDDDPIIRVIDEDEILFLTKVGKDFIGIFLDSAGKICAKNSMSITTKGIKDIVPTNKHIIVMEKILRLHVFSKTDVQHLQVIDIENPSKYLFLSNSMEDVYVATRNSVHFLRLQPYDNQIQECLDKCQGKKALSIFDSYYSPSYKTRDILLLKLYYDISWAYLNRKMYKEAQESFAHSSFDPLELLEREFPDYLQINYKRDRGNNPFYKKEPLNFLINVFMKKRQQILKEYPQPEQENINRLHTQGGEIKASVWVEYIDYALIKCMIEMKYFKELANFFKNAGKIYCHNIQNEVEVFVRVIEKHVSDEKLKYTILAFLYEIVKMFAKSLDSWKKVSILSKVGDTDNSHYTNSIRILINCQSDKSLFFNLLSDHVNWLAKGDYMTDLFDQVRVDTILPEEIHRRLQQLTDLEYLNSILESFYDVMIHKHNLRTERYHTELAKLYLKYIFESKNERYYPKLHFFLREDFANYEGNEIREKIEEYVEDNPNYMKDEILTEEIFLLGREKRHDEAIKTLLAKKKFKMAEEYCSSKTDNLLTQLFKEYISIYEDLEGETRSQREMLARIHMFLLKYATHNELDPAEVLREIPDDWLLSEGAMFTFLISSLSRSEHMRKNMKAKRQLSEINLQNSSYKLVKAQKAWIKITERDKCNVCNRKIGDKVFDVYPNGVTIIHTCMNKNSPFICPNTSQNFALTFNF